MKKQKAVLYGINNYGFEFKIPVVFENWQHLNNLLNNRFSSFFYASVPVHNGKSIKFQPVAFSSMVDKNLLRSSQLFWTKVCYEDGTEIVNRNSEIIAGTVKINRELIETKYRKQFDADLNKYVGQPVAASNNFTGGKANGILLSVEPRKEDKSPMAYVFIDNTATFILPVNSESKIIAYPFDEKEPVEIKNNQTELTE